MSEGNPGRTEEDLLRRIHFLQEENEKLEELAQFLFNRLDDIDTAEDMVKNDDKAFRELAHKIHQRRFEVAATDGYHVWWTPRESSVPETSIPDE